MAYFPDLSPYAYGYYAHPGVVHVGWLDDRVVIDPKCSWWRWADERSSNGEIRVSRGGVTFAAPVLIVHYIQEHGYLPPSDFLKAVEEAVN